VIYLHIGRHKTGTSAIQHFLSRNRVRLRKLGWEYPRALSGQAAHHDYAYGLEAAHGRARPEARPGLLRREVERMGPWLQQPGRKIVSSEAFQNLDPEWLRGVFPAGRTRVVVYLREPLDYLISSYAQTIQANAVRTPFVNYAAGFRPEYARFLGRWAEVFGEAALDVRIYDRGRLAGGDILHDFVDALGLPVDELRFPPGGYNPSIGPELIEAKGVVNAVVPQARQAELKLYARLGRLGRRFPGRLQVTPAFAEAYRGRFAAANAEVFARFLGRPGEGFPLKDGIVGAPRPIDPGEAVGRVLDAIARRSPDVARELRAAIPADLSDLKPLLPTDWDAAAAQVAGA
jgi:hypothetical protein